MSLKVFYSFHYEADCWRTQQIRNIGALQGNPPVSHTHWEEIKSKGNRAIEQWISLQLRSAVCVVVLVGEHTAYRDWVQFEIAEGWRTGKGVLGIRIHNLRDQSGRTSDAGPNPFELTPARPKGSFSKIAPLYDPGASDTYNVISRNLKKWIADAISKRRRIRGE